MPERDPLEDIVDQLDRHHQRATYGAVAGHLGRVARSLMLGKPPSRRYSWIVAKKTGEPTRYPPEHVHPALEERPRVLTTPQELADWLEAVQSAESDARDEDERGVPRALAPTGPDPASGSVSPSGDRGPAERASGGWAALMRVIAVVAGAWRFITGR